MITSSDWSQVYKTTKFTIKSIENKTALIIGGSGGLGKEIALTLAKENVNFIVQGRNLEKLKKLENQFEEIQKTKSNQRKNTITLLHQNFTKNENNITSLNFYVNSADILIVCYGPFLQKELQSEKLFVYLQPQKGSVA